MTKTQKTATYVLIPLVLAGIIGGAAYAVLRPSTSPARHTAVTAKQPAQQSARSTGSTANGMQLQDTSAGSEISLTQQSNNPQNQGLQVGNGNGVSGAGSASNSGGTTLPSPSEFAQYDQYKDKTELFYIDTQAGTGTAAANGKKVAVVYKGWLTNGTLFDQTKTNEQNQLMPIGFTLGQGQVIKGWDIGFDGMKVGGMRRLIVPPALGYGEAGAANGVIPANAVLVFDVQLVAVE